MAVAAHAPGSVTVIFVPQDGERSLGISFAVADGTTVTVERAPKTVVFLDGTRATVEAVSGVLRRLGVTAAVRVETEVPIGCGFGVSGAATLGTALAANAAWGLGRDRSVLVQAAHRAEVAAGTGLGDVFIQNEGGLVWDRGDGMRRVARADRLQYTTYGGVATADVLGDEGTMERVKTAGQSALASVDPEGALAPLFRTSWTFAEKTDLASDRIAATVGDVWAENGAATMAMIGETVVATGADGVLDRETQITRSGATLL